MADDRDIRFLKMPDVQERVGLCPAMIYRLIERGEFPKQVKIGRSSFWPDNAIREWQQARLSA